MNELRCPDDCMFKDVMCPCCIDGHYLSCQAQDEEDY